MSRRTVFWTLAALAVLAAAMQSWVLRFTCDDAFVSLRYARHFVDGHGLVFNLDPSEAPVEGYTNFSWTMLLALGMQLGLDDRAIGTWASAWGTLAHAGTVLLLAAIAWRASGGRALVPIAACGYAAIHHAASLAPAGLETASFTLLLTALLRGALALRCAREAWLLGFLGVLAAMTRPDGAIPVAMAGLFVAYDTWRRRAPRLLLGYVVPFVVVFAPYLLWRHSFYGQWLPNTFYAKSGDDPFVSAGLAYCRGYFTCYWPLLLAIVPLVYWPLRKPDLLATISPFLGRRPWLALLAFVGSYLAFVVWVGGDFMFARFLLPLTPGLLLAFDFACLRWRPLWLQPALGALVVLGCVFRIEPPGLANPFQDVSDNRAFTMSRVGSGEHSMTWLAIGQETGARLGELFDGLPVRIAIAGSHAVLAFHSHVPVAVECAAGLTDAHIARLPVPVRGKRGHDKPRDPGYLERRRVHFMFETNYREEDTWRKVHFPLPPLGIDAQLVTWDRELMAELRRRLPILKFADFEQHLDAYLADLPNKTKDQVRADYAKFRGFWFDHTPDPERQQRFEAFLR